MRGSLGNGLMSLARGAENQLGLLPAGVAFPERRMQDVPLREVVSSEFEAVLLEARRKVEENIIISDHKLHELGGEPVWVQRHEGPEPKVGVASTGAYRSARHRGLKKEVGHFLHDDVQECFGWGRFWRATDRSNAARWSEGAGQRIFPEIDVLLERAVCIPPEQVQLDALFRTVETVLSGFRGIWASLPASCRKEALPFASEIVPDRELSRRRLIVLRDFAKNDTGYWWNSLTDPSSVRNTISSFDPGRRLKRYRKSRPSLTPKEEAALTALDHY